MALMLLFVFPLAYILPGSDAGGCVENVWDSLAMVRHSTHLQLILAAFFVSVRSFVMLFVGLCPTRPRASPQPLSTSNKQTPSQQVAAYNIFAVYVTHFLSSVWHAILDNFRPISVWGAFAHTCMGSSRVCWWMHDTDDPLTLPTTYLHTTIAPITGTDLLIYYVLSHGAFGEAWTKYSWLQFSGMLLLFFGTAGACGLECLAAVDRWRCDRLTPLHSTHTINHSSHAVYNGSIPWLIFEGDAYYSAVGLEEERAEKGGTCHTRGRG